MATTRRMTAEDLWLMDDDEHRYELVRGELVHVTPAGGKHGQTGGMLLTYLNLFVGPRRLGYVFAGDTSFRITRDPDTVRLPDVAFVRAERLPEGPPTSFIPFAPDIAAEVISPSDTAIEVHAKVDDYLDAGVQVVWLIDPRNKTVTIYRTKESARVLRIVDTLDGEDVLPGFSVAVADIFDPWLNVDP